MWLYPEIKIVSDLVGHHAGLTPDKTALIFGDTRMSFRELNLSSDRIAASLVRNMPAKTNVGFIGKNSITHWELFFGTIKAGCTWVPLNWRLAPAELADIIEHAECTFVFVERAYAEMMSALCEAAAGRFQIVLFDPAVSAASLLDSAPLNGGKLVRTTKIAPNDTAFMLYTSGTTGKPKGVLISHQAINFQRLSEELGQAQTWNSDDVLLLVMPNFHFLGLNTALMALYRGCTVSMLPAMDAGQVLKTLKKDRATVTALVPTAIQMLLDHPDASPDTFASLRLIAYGGSSIGAETLRRALVEMKCEFVQYYGITETTGPITVLKPDQHDPNDEATLKSCGRAVPLVDVRIVDTEGNDVESGTIGELLIRTPSLFEGYWNNPTATAEAMSGVWYRSGDAGYRDSDGLFYVVDRIKDMIVTGGENVYSSEVELALEQHDGVRAVAVVGIPDLRWGDKVVAVVVLQDGATATAEELIAHCRTRIAGYKVPRSIHFAASLPLSGAGKVLKRVLRDQLKDESQHKTT